MQRTVWHGWWVLLFPALSVSALGQQPLTWQQIQDRFEAANPTLQADQLNIDESKAQEITAYLRPNPSSFNCRWNPDRSHRRRLAAVRRNL